MNIKTNAYVGQVFGALVVMEILPSIKKERKTGVPFSYLVPLRCVCRCGKEVVRTKKALVAGDKWHCGKRACKDNRYNHVQ